MKHPKVSHYIFLLVIFSALPACTEEILGQFGSIFEIRDRLVKEYQHDKVHINIHNGASLTVTFVNSAFNDMNAKDRKAGAQNIATTTATLLEADTRVKKLAVAFTQHETKYLVVNYNRSFGNFVFDVPTLMRAMPEKPAITPAQPTG